MLDQPLTAGTGQEFFATSLIGGGNTAGQAHRCEEGTPVGEACFCRGALRGRSPCTREGRRPDRPKYNNEGRKTPLLPSFRFANQLRLSSYHHFQISTGKVCGDSPWPRLFATTASLKHGRTAGRTAGRQRAFFSGEIEQRESLPSPLLLAAATVISCSSRI